MIDFKEYSRQRDIAVKRVKRLQESGMQISVHIPTVKEVRGKSDFEQNRLFSALSGFLEGGMSLSRQKQRKKQTAEQRKKEKREYQRDYRRRKVAQEHERPGRKTYQSYVKGVKTLGVDIKPSQLPAFFAYMDYRFAQGTASIKYAFDLFLDDFQRLLQKGYNPNQILSDFEKFQADQADISSRADDMDGTSSSAAKEMWDKFIGDD